MAERKMQNDPKEEEKLLEGLPTKTSPYTQYKDVEDYKMQGYGSQGHLQPQPGRGAAGSVDAPSEAGGQISTSISQHSDNSSSVNRHSV